MISARYFLLPDTVPTSRPRLPLHFFFRVCRFLPRRQLRTVQAYKYRLAFFIFRLIFFRVYRFVSADNSEPCGPITRLFHFLTLFFVSVASPPRQHTSEQCGPITWLFMFRLIVFFSCVSLFCPPTRQSHAGLYHLVLHFRLKLLLFCSSGNAVPCGPISWRRRRSRARARTPTR